MTTAKGIGGAILVLLGLIWIGQGLNLLKGSGMSGHGIFAAIGLVVLVVGAWLLYSLTRTRGQAARS